MISIDEKTSSYLGHLISLTTLITLTFACAFEVLGCLGRLRDRLASFCACSSQTGSPSGGLRYVRRPLISLNRMGDVILLGSYVPSQFGG